MPQQTINPMQVVIQNGAITENHDHSLITGTLNSLKNGRAKLSKYIVYIMSFNIVTIFTK
jgi:hypothetical protein